MRHARQESPTWPFLLLLAVLLIFTATAPRGWENVARRQAIRSCPPSAGGRAPATAIAARKSTSRSRHTADPIDVTVDPPSVSPVFPVLEQPLAAQDSAQPLADNQQAPTSPVPTIDLAGLNAEAPPPPAIQAEPAVETSPGPAEPARAADAYAEPARAPTAPASRPWWPIPQRLLAQLDVLKAEHATAPWASRAAGLIHELVDSGPPAEGRADDILVELKSLVAAPGNFLAAPAGDAAGELSKARFALSRRLDIWQRVVDAASPQAQREAARAQAQRLNDRLAAVETELSRDPAGATWRQYLLLDSLKRLPAGPSESDEYRLATTVLSRFESAALKRSQREFLAREPLAALKAELQVWASDPIDLRQLLEHVERFESTGLASDGRLVAADFNRLARSCTPADDALALWLDTDYRNANLRLSLSPELLNRLVPPQRPRIARVRDLFMGHPTEGWSETDTRVAFRLIPDPRRLHVAVEARGETSSEADTTNGPVVVHTHSDSQFVGWKEVTLGPDGVQSVPAVAEADSAPRLRWVKSDFDIIPIVGSVVREVARAQHEDSQSEVRSQTRRKIRREVTEQIDSQLSPRIARANQRLQQRIIEPLDELGVQTEMIEAQTSVDRLTTRLRLAAETQLAGSGPRPRAPAGCLASIQMHQSLLNNICQQLGWEGKTFTLAQLRDELSQKLRMELAPPAANIPHDLTLTFAAADAIHIVCDDGRVELNLALAKLQKPPEQFRDFVVRVHYKPDLESGSGRLVRDGTVQLIGDRLRPKAQLALRGIFSKTFPPSRSMPLVPAGMTARPGLAELHAVQCEIRDGWIGLAFDLARDVAAATNVARQPADNR